MDEQLPSKLRRVLQVLSLIQSGLRLNAGNLASELRVSRRTIFRDVDLLRDSGIPIYFDESWGCYRIDPAFRMPQHGRLSEEEIGLLVLAAQTSPLNDSPDLSQQVRCAILSLVACLPDELKSSGALIVDHCTYSSMPPAAPVAASVLLACLRGIQSRRQISLRLVGSDAGSDIQLAPWHLLRRPQNWSVLGLMLPEARNCQIGLHRVESAIVTTDAFERPIHIKTKHMVSAYFPEV